MVAVDGDAVDESHDLSTRILPHVPGDTVTLSVVRDGRTMEISVTLGTLPDDPLAAAPAADPHLDSVKGPGQRGLWLADSDLHVVDRVGGEHGVGDRPRQRLEQVERAPLDDLARQLEEASRS